jgi:outer membrane protein assembly factor BamB
VPRASFMSPAAGARGDGLEPRPLPLRKTLMYVGAACVPAMSHRLLAAVGVLSLLVPAASADWASFHGDALNTGSVVSDYEVYKEVLWSERGTSDRQVVSSPVVKDGRLIVADRGGFVRALDIQSGFEYWRYKMPASVEGTPAVFADHVYVADIKGNLKSINLRDGRVEFEASVGATAGNIAEHEGKIFLGTEAGEVRAYLSDLTLLWIFKPSDWYEGPVGEKCGDITTNQEGVAMSNQPIRGKPAVYNGYVFVGSLNHYLYALLEGGLGNQKTTMKWFFRASDVFVGAPTIVDGRVVAASYDGHVYSFTATPPGSAWPQNCPDDKTGRKQYAQRVLKSQGRFFAVPDSQGQVTKIFSSPANANGNIYFGANNGLVYALRASDMKHLWNRTAGSDITPVRSSPAVSNGIVIVGSDDKNVYWLSAANGSAQSAVQSSPALDGKLAFVAALDGTWYAFAPEKPPRPDLVVTSLKATRTQVTVSVVNQGNAASGETTVRILTNGALLLDLVLPRLEPGANVTIGNSSQAFAKGKLEVRAILDPENKVVESVESNNQQQINVDIPAAPRPQPTAAPNTGSPTGKVPFWQAAVPLALLGVALMLRRRIG